MSSVFLYSSFDAHKRQLCLVRFGFIDPCLACLSDSRSVPPFGTEHRARSFGTGSFNQGWVVRTLPDRNFIRIAGMRFLFCLLGLVLIVEGIPYFAAPDKMKKWMSAVQEIPDRYLRAMGFLAMALGLLIAYFFKE